MRPLHKEVKMKIAFLKNLKWLFVLSTLLACSPVKFSTKDSTTPPVDCTEGVDCPPCTPGVDCPKPLDQFVWTVGEWGSCSQPCKQEGVNQGGTQDRSVSCRSTKNEVVAESNCKEAKPITQRACNTQSCPPSGSGAFWNPGPWGECSPACEPGTQTRTVTCMKAGGVVSDNECTPPKPETSMACRTNCPPNLREETLSFTVDQKLNDVDILLVFDDSGSMTQDNQKLAGRLAGFISELSSLALDWQMCVTTTDTAYYQGRPIKWSGTNSHILRQGTANIGSVIQNTIAGLNPLNGDKIVYGSNDEQGIKATYWNYARTHTASALESCQRPNTAFAVILISDEDERSVGGNQALSAQQYKPLENVNKPGSLVQMINERNSSKKFNFNSIVVRDETCRTQQNTQGNPSFIGKTYLELSSLTEGGVGSICDNDYTQSLKYFKEIIHEKVSSKILKCVPVSTPSPIAALPPGYSWKIEVNTVVFTPALPPGTSFSMVYRCPEIGAL